MSGQRGTHPSSGANVEEDAFILGTLDVGGTPLVTTSYLFHEGDDDWFVFTAPANGTVVIDWDHSAVSSGPNGLCRLSTPCQGC